MNNLKNNDITQKKIKEFKYTRLMTYFTSTSYLPSNSETTSHNLKMSNYNTKWTYKAIFEITLHFHYSKSRIEYIVEFLVKL